MVSLQKWQGIYTVDSSELNTFKHRKPQYQINVSRVSLWIGQIYFFLGKSLDITLTVPSVVIPQRYPCLCISHDCLSFFYTISSQIFKLEGLIKFNLDRNFQWSIVYLKLLVSVSNEDTFNFDDKSLNSSYPCRVWSPRDVEEDQCYIIRLTI